MAPFPSSSSSSSKAKRRSAAPTWHPFVRANAELLAADACLWEGSMKDGSGRPMIYCGTKGLAYVELLAKGASYDLHSMYGNIAPNPAWRLVQALRTLKDEDGNVTLDGLDELADEPSEKDLEAIRNIPFDAEDLRKSPGASSPSTVTSRAKKP